MSSLIRSRRAAALVLSVGLLSACHSTTHTLAQRSAPSQAAASGVVNPKERPSVLPTVSTALSGKCRTVHADIQKLIQRFPSGVLLDDQGNKQLSSDLTQLDAQCSASVAAAVRSVEITPWLTYAPPGVHASISPSP